MNLYCIGTAFLLFQLNFDWISNYVVKLLGFAFMFGGTLEMLDFISVRGSDKSVLDLSQAQTDNVKYLKKVSLAMGFVCAVAVLCQLLMRYLSPSAIAGNVISTILGVSVTALSVDLFRKVYNFIHNCEMNAVTSSESLVNNTANVVRLGKSFGWYSILTALNLVSDVLNRFVSSGSVRDIAGICVAVTKIAMYIFLVVIVVGFNKLRVDFEHKFEDK